MWNEAVILWFIYLAVQGTWVQTLVGELGSPLPWGKFHVGKIFFKKATNGWPAHWSPIKKIIKIKGYESGTARWKRYPELGMGSGGGPSWPLQVQKSLAPPWCTCLSTQKLYKPILLDLIEASLHQHDWLNHWPLVTDSVSSPSPLCRDQGLGPESTSPLIV